MSGQAGLETGRRIGGLDDMGRQGVEADDLGAAPEDVGDRGAGALVPCGRTV